MPSINFSYPRRGLYGEFTTFRLGLATAKKFTVGDEVELLASGTGKLLGRATVVAIDTGQLDAMAALYGHLAHNWREHPFIERPALLTASMIRRSFPGRCCETSIVTVIHFREVPHD